MKKLVIMFFLFLGGISLLGKAVNVEAVDMRSHSTISFEDTYIYVPKEELEEGVTPTGVPPKPLLGQASGNSFGKGSYLLPKTGETTGGWFQIAGLIAVTSVLTQIKTGRRNER